MIACAIRYFLLLLVVTVTQGYNPASSWRCRDSFVAIDSKGTALTWGALSSSNDNVRSVFSHKSAIAYLLDSGEVETVNEDTNIYLTNIEHIYSTESAFVALDADHTIYCWGNEEEGGDCHGVESENVDYVVCGFAACAALYFDGTVSAWGDDTVGGYDIALTGVSRIWAGGYAFVAMYYDGSISCWGDAEYGGDCYDTNTAIDGGMATVREIYASKFAFVMVSEEGSVYPWGSSSFGGSLQESSWYDGTGLSSVTKVYTNELAMCAVSSTLETNSINLESHFINCWGFGSYGGQTDGYDFKEIPVSVTTSKSAFCAVYSDGSTKCWGDGGTGGSGTSANDDVMYIVSTEQAMCAMHADDSISCWGNSLYGGVTPTDSHLYSSLASNKGAMCGIRNSGLEIATWGEGGYGGVGGPSTSGDATFSSVWGNTLWRSDSSLAGSYMLGNSDFTAAPSLAPTSLPTIAGATRSPTSSPTKEYCEDLDSLYGSTGDKFGDGCEWYDSAQNSASCGLYDDDDFDAVLYCCSCSGGNRVAPTSMPTISAAPSAPGSKAPSNSPTTSSPSSTPTFMPSLSPTSIINEFCNNTDTESTVDSGGDGCIWYDEFADECGRYDDDDFSAGEMCCSCGGGFRTAMPTTLPVAMPTSSPTNSARPTSMPSSRPSTAPSSIPSGIPTSMPTPTPTSVPSVLQSFDSLFGLQRGAPWPAFGRSGYRHRNSLFSGPVTSNIRWAYDSDAGIRSSPVVDADEAVYFGNDDDLLIKVARDGTMEWEYDCEGNIYSSPALGTYGDVYIGSSDGLFAVNMGTGLLSWSFGEAEGMLDGVKSSPIVDADGYIYFGGEDSIAYKLTSAGDVVWTYTMKDSVSTGSIALTADGILLIPCDDGLVFALNATMNSCDNSVCFLYSYDAGASVRSTPLISTDNVAFVTTRGAAVHAFDVATGTQKWIFHEPVGADIDASPAIEKHNLIIYVATMDGQMHAIAAKDAPGAKVSAGDLIWTINVGPDGDQVDSSPAVDVDGNIFVGSHDGFVYAYTSDGSELWSKSTGDEIDFSSIAIGGTGAIYVGSMDGFLYAFGPDSDVSPCVKDDLVSMNSDYLSTDNDLECVSFCPGGYGNSSFGFCELCAGGTYSSAQNFSCITCGDDNPISEAGSTGYSNCTDGSSAPSSQPTLTPTSMPSTQAPTAMPSVPTSLPTIVPTAEPTSEPTTVPTGEPTGEPTSEPTMAMITEIEFSNSQLMTATDLSAADLLDDESYTNVCFRAALANVTGIALDDFTIDSVTTIPGRRRRRLQTEETFEVEYTVKVSTQEMQTLGGSTSESAYDVLVGSLRSATTDSGDGTPFSAALSAASNAVASEWSTDVSTQALALQTIVPQGPVTSDSFTETLVSSPFPSSMPSSAPSCGVGMENGANGCGQCEPGYYGSVQRNDQGLSVYQAGGEKVCIPCAIDTYSPNYGDEQCDKCPFPYATLNTASDECDAVTLAQGDLLTIIVYSIIGVVMIATAYLSKRDRAATVFFTAAPALDFVSDVVYVTQVKFLDMTVFVAGIIVLFLAALTFINQLRKIRAKPGFFIAFPGYYVFDHIIFLSSHKYAPMIDGKPAPGDFKRHDDLPKVIAFCIIWILSIAVQVLWIAFYLFWCALHCLWWGPVLIFGMFLFLMKAICVKRIWNAWIWAWTLDGTKHQKSLEFTDTDAGMFNESLLAEFFLESIPQLTLQAMNNYAVNAWGDPITVFSFVFSLIVVVNSIYRFGYYVYIQEMDVVDVPMRVKVPGCFILELQADEVEALPTEEDDIEKKTGLDAMGDAMAGMFTGEVSEVEKELNWSHVHFEKRCNKAWKDIASELSLDARYLKRHETLSELLVCLQEHHITSAESLMLADKKALVELAKICTGSAALSEISGYAHQKDDEDRANQAKMRAWLASFFLGSSNAKEAGVATDGVSTGDVEMTDATLEKKGWLW